MSDPGAAPPGPVPKPAVGPAILILNHRRDPLRNVVEALRRAGHRATEVRSLAESMRTLDRRTPDLLILNPVVLRDGGVELGLAERVQTPERPVPVLLLVESLSELTSARPLAAPIHDFVLKPASGEEVAIRVEAALARRAQLLEFHARARELEDQASIDHKTELLSDRYFHQIVQIEFKRAQRHQTPLSMLLIDVDDFKTINDSTSYAFGDAVLKQVARTLKQSIRETDFAARFGGDEFILLLPHTTPAEAVQTAMRIRKRIAQMVVRRGEFSRSVTLSIGIDTYDGRTESTPEELRARANKALHRAKWHGKNQVWLFSEEEPPAKTVADARPRPE